MVVDFFSHSGTTLIASAKNNRRCFTMDVDPIFCEITIRRIERFLETGKLGWQNGNPFEIESDENVELQEFLGKKFIAEKSSQATLF